MGMTQNVRETAGGLLRWRESAPEWLARHRLPAGEETVALVSGRLRARRRGWPVDGVVVLTVVLAGWWLLADDQLWDGPDLMPWLWVPVAAVVVGDVLRRWLVWARWDRRARAAQTVRVASLSPPTWDDLVGTRAIRGAVLLLGAGLAIAIATYWSDGAVAATMSGVLVLAAAVHPAVLLEVARRRPVTADSETAIAVNDRLRGEEANHAATFGLFWVVLVPVVSGRSDLTLSLVVFVGYLFVVSMVRHRYAYEQVNGELVAR
jgi:hypothetical protein